MEKLNIFLERMRKLGIIIELIGNYPWIYIDTINGHRITEKFYSDHRFTIGFSPIRTGSQFTFTDISKIFKIIRKYR